MKIPSLFRIVCNFFPFVLDVGTLRQPFKNNVSHITPHVSLTQSAREYFKKLAFKKNKKLNFKRLYLKSCDEFRVKTNIFRIFLHTLITWVHDRGLRSPTIPDAAMHMCDTKTFFCTDCISKQRFFVKDGATISKSSANFVCVMRKYLKDNSWSNIRRSFARISNSHYCFRSWFSSRTQHLFLALAVCCFFHK